MGTLYRRLGSAAILVLALLALLAAAGSAQASSPPTAPSNVKLAPDGALHFYLTWTPG
jgi:ABC-type glycerol-3-phosphate transport system substrate-binding protein